MEPPYSVAADFLSKFSTWPGGIQALWILAFTAVALALILSTTRIVTTVIDAVRACEPGRRGTTALSPTDAGAQSRDRTDIRARTYHSHSMAKPAGCGRTLGLRRDRRMAFVWTGLDAPLLPLAGRSWRWGSKSRSCTRYRGARGRYYTSPLPRPVVPPPPLIPPRKGEGRRFRPYDAVTSNACCGTLNGPSPKRARRTVVTASVARASPP